MTLPAVRTYIPAIKAKSKNYDVRVGGVIVNRSEGTDQVDRFNKVCGTEIIAHFPNLDAIRRSRLKKSTLFEMEETPEILAVQREYLKLAATMWAGNEGTIVSPLKDREIFDLLGYD